MATKKHNARNLWKEFFALPERERLLAVVALVGFLFLLTDFVWVRARNAETKETQAQLDQVRNQIEGLARAKAEATKPLPPEVTAKKREERDALRAALQRAETTLQQASGDVRMGDMIRTLAANAPGVTLVSLRTVAAQPFYVPTAVAPAAPAPTAASKPASAAAVSQAPAVPQLPPLPAVYRHGLEVTLKGSYASLVPYLRSLETGIPGVYWGTTQMTVGTYPEATIRVTLYTLSTQQELSFE